MQNTSLPVDIRSIEAFLFREAALLDEKRFDEWLTLFTHDCHYWVPLSAAQKNSRDELSIIDDDHDMLKVRIHWLSHPKNHAQAIPSRTVHYVSNILLLDHDPDQGEQRVSSALQVAEYRDGSQVLHAGRCTHVLRSVGHKLKIVSKRIDLVNSESFLGHLSIPL